MKFTLLYWSIVTGALSPFYYFPRKHFKIFSAITIDFLCICVFWYNYAWISSPRPTKIRGFKWRSKNIWISFETIRSIGPLFSLIKICLVFAFLISMYFKFKKNKIKLCTSIWLMYHHFLFRKFDIKWISIKAEVSFTNAWLLRRFPNFTRLDHC